MHQTDSIAAVAILSEFSRYSSEIFDEILLFLCFILDNNWSQMYILLKTDEVNKVCLWSEGYFSLVRESGTETWQNLSLSWRSDCNSAHCIGKCSSNISIWTENGVTIAKKIDFFFWNLETYSQIYLSKWKVQLHIFHCWQDCVEPTYQNTWNYLP